MLNGKLQLLSLFSEIGVLQKEDFSVVVGLCGEIIEKASTSLQDKYRKEVDEEEEV